MLIFDVVKTATTIIKKVIELHEANVDIDVLKTIHAAVTTVHDTVHEMHRKHVGHGTVDKEGE